MISKKIGIIGGGQLGKMLISETNKMNIYTIVLDPDKDCVSARLANDNIVASFDSNFEAD